MSPSSARVFHDLVLDHTQFYVDDVTAEAAWFADGWGLTAYPVDEPHVTRPSGRVEGVGSGGGRRQRTLGVGGGDIRFVLTEPVADDHPATRYLARHGSGVADIALRVGDATKAFEEALRRGARPVAEPRPCGATVRATIAAFGDVTHTFVQRGRRQPTSIAARTRAMVGAKRESGVDASSPGSVWDTGLSAVDHFAVCLEPGGVAPLASFYKTVLDFRTIFSERIVVGDQAMTTTVVQSRTRNRSGAVTLTLIEPDAHRVAGHLHEFLASHDGPGVQHIAFRTPDILRAVSRIRSRGVEFLSAPGTYYQQLRQRLAPQRHPFDDLRRQNILVDEDHDGQLFQIFTRSVHPRNTIFFEVIERLGAQGFGSGNITALYRAVELERDRTTATAA